MAIKLLVADLDGTVVPKSQIISERNLAAIRAAEAKGVKVTFATGRMHASAEAFARLAQISLPIITCNGALVKSCAGEVVFENIIDAKIVKEVINFCLAKQWHIQWYVGGELYVYKKHNGLFTGYDDAEKIEIHEASGDLDRYTQKVIQLVVLNRDGKIKQISQTLQKNFSDSLFTPQTSAFCVDVVAKGMHKAVGIDILAKKYGILPEEVMAIGDSENDMDMIRYAGLGVAMGNAFDSVKKAADYITLSCEEDGFAAAVEKFILNKNE